MQESGCMLEHPAAAQFRKNLLEGDWEKVHTNKMCLLVVKLYQDILAFLGFVYHPSIQLIPRFRQKVILMNYNRWWSVLKGHL